jgi:hypothetical protein
MTETQKKFDKIENKLRVRYSKLSKVFLIIAFLFTIWIVFAALGVFILEKGPDWALLTLDNWVYAWCVLIGFFIVLELFFYFHYVFVRNRRLEQEKPRSESYRGKRLYVYTHPRGVEGGIFSKTYIQIDGYSMLRLRTLMIPPGDLWSKKEEK